MIKSFPPPSLLLDRYGSAICLFILIILGSYLRIYSIRDFGLSLDDISHIRLSTAGSIYEVWINSYKDAHPPLRNILLHLILNNSSNVNAYRLVSFLPGILLIPAFYLLIFNIYKSRAAGLFGAVTLTFSSLFISLSHDTRPYSLAALFLTVHLHAWNTFLRVNSRRFLIVFMVSGCLSLFTDYGVIAIILSIALTGLGQLLLRRRYKSAELWLIISAFNLAVFLTQIWLVYSNSPYAHKMPEPLAAFVKTDLLSVAENMKEIISVNLSHSERFSNCMLFLFIAGIYCEFRRRSWKNLELVIFSSAAFILMSKLGLYPLRPGRHTFLLSLVLLIPVCGLVKAVRMPEWGFRGMLQIPVSTLLFFCLFSPVISLSNPSNLYSRETNLYRIGFSRKEYSALDQAILSPVQQPDSLLTSVLMERLILKGPEFAGISSAGYNALPKVFCPIRILDFTTEIGVDYCLKYLIKQSDYNASGKLYAYLLSSYDPSISKDLPVDIISVTRLNPERPFYYFTFRLKDAAINKKSDLHR